MNLINSELQKKLHRNRLVAFFWALKRYTKCTPTVRQRMAEELKVYGLPARRLNRALFRMYFDCTRHQVTTDEYFSYHFLELSEIGKHSFVGEGEKYRVLESMYDEKTVAILDNKYESYRAMRPLYGREMILVDRETPFEQFLKFTRGHSKFMSKPYNLSKGRGIHVFDVSGESEEALKVLYSQILDSSGTVVLEELIQQAPEMAAFHPASVNTVRIATFLGPDGKVVPIFSIIRMGLGGSVVDNSSSGGIMASVDIASGVVKTAAVSRRQRETFLFHPDTGRQIIGFRIPDWDKVIALVSQAARQFPNQRYVGWDLALTDSGWVIVEANARPACGFQIAERKGGRELFQAVMDF